MRGLGSIPRKEHGVRSLNAILANVELLVRDVMKNQGRHREDSRKMLADSGKLANTTYLWSRLQKCRAGGLRDSRPATTAPAKEKWVPEA
jgi:hypothetical protein